MNPRPRMRIWQCFFLGVVVCFTAATASDPPSADLPTTLTVDGVTYENVRWGTVTPARVTIFHKTGVATIPLEKLPPELQEQFGYDPKRASEYRALQAAQARAAQEVRTKAKTSTPQQSPAPQGPVRLDANLPMPKAETRDVGVKGNVEKIAFYDVGEIREVAAGRYQSQVLLADGSEACVEFDEKGRRFLESCVKKFDRHDERLSGLEKQKEEAEKIKVRERFERFVLYRSGGWRRVTEVEPGRGFAYTEYSRRCSVYGVRHQGKQCFSLVGSEEVVRTGGQRDYRW